MATGRKIIIAIDDSDCSLSAAKWAYITVVRPGDEVQLIGCQALISAGMAPAAPLATAGSVVALTANYQQALRDEEHRVKALLVHVKNEVLQHGGAHLHCLPAAGGASGVGESIVAWSKKEHADLVVVGSRGMGATKSALMSVVGLGSVSSYCLHYLHTAIAVVHGTNLDEQKHVRKIMVAVDDSEMAQHAQRWAIDNILGSNDELHLVAVALPVPYVAGVQAPIGVAHAPAGAFEEEYRGAMEHAEETCLHALRGAQASGKIAADDAAAAHVLEVAEEEEASKESKEYAETLAAAAVEAAQQSKVDKKRIFFKALEPEGGASDVGKSLKHYAEANQIDVLVMGSRGMGAVKRALLSMVGLGSVSDWCAHNMTCPVIVVKSQQAMGKAAAAAEAMKKD